MQWSQRPRVRPKRILRLRIAQQYRRLDRRRALEDLHPGGWRRFAGERLYFNCARLDQGQQQTKPGEAKQLTWHLRTSANNSNAIAKWMARIDLLGANARVCR